RDFGKEPAGAAIEIVAGHDLLAGPHQTGDGGEGGHAAGEGAGVPAAFESGDLLFGQGAGGIGGARVVVLAEVYRRRLAEGRGLIDRRRHRAKGIAVRGDAHTAGRDLHAATSTPSVARSKRSAITASVVGQRPAPRAVRSVTRPSRLSMRSALSALRALAKR